MRLQIILDKGATILNNVATLNKEPQMKKITNVKTTVFGTFGECEGKECEFCRATMMWFFTDRSGYIYGATR